MSDAIWELLKPYTTGNRGDMERQREGHAAISEWNVLDTAGGCAVDAHGMPVRLGTAADCTQACSLIEGIPAEYLLAGCGYDSNEIIGKALARHCYALCQAYLVVRYCCPNPCCRSPGCTSSLALIGSI